MVVFFIWKMTHSKFSLNLIIDDWRMIDDISFLEIVDIWRTVDFIRLRHYYSFDSLILYIKKEKWRFFLELFVDIICIVDWLLFWDFCRWGQGFPRLSLIRVLRILPSSLIKKFSIHLLKILLPTPIKVPPVTRPTQKSIISFLRVPFGVFDSLLTSQSIDDYESDYGLNLIWFGGVEC